MRTIEVDEEVFAGLQALAVPFEDHTPNDVLRRRVLKLPESAPVGGTSANNDRRPTSSFGNEANGNGGSSTRRRRTKAPKADLQTLVAAGLLEGDQVLLLRDYKNTVIPGSEAQVRGKKLHFEGRSWSMSRLAAELLRRHGYDSMSVRGPAHWFTIDGVSVKDLWSKYRRTKAATR